MAAGENTLNAVCARVVMRGIAANGGIYSPERFLEDYVAFMTTPGSHNDTYAGVWGCSNRGVVACGVTLLATRGGGARRGGRPEQHGMGTASQAW